MSDPAPWIWFIVAAVLVGIELGTGTFMCLLFAVAAALAGGVALLGLGLPLQGATFLAGVIASIAAAPALVRRQRRHGSGERFGVDALIDQVAQVIEPIDPLRGTGRVRIAGDTWRAVCAQPVPEGGYVRISEVDGTKLVVYPVEVDQPAGQRLADPVDAPAPLTELDR